jgi:hypothetical protein
MSSSIPINKENSLNLLATSVRVGQKMGAYLLREASLLMDAIDYFNPDVTDKPTFEGTGSENPEIVAVNLLLQGVHKAQMHGGDMSYSLEDARLLWKITEFWVKELGKGVTQNMNLAGSSKPVDKKAASKAAASARKNEEEHEDDDEEEDENVIRPMQTVSKDKGKGRAL